MKCLTTSLLFCFFSFSYLLAQNNVTIDATAEWIGFMNVSNLPADGGAYEFGSFWGLEDLKSTLDEASNTVILQPNFNTYDTNDPYWTNPSTLEGNKIMEGLTFIEPGDAFNNNDLTFSGTILSNTLSSDYSVFVFIKALDPMNEYVDVLEGSKVIELPASGSFSVSATAEELAPGLLVQYGFSVVGLNANPANESALGNITIGAVTTSTDDLVEAFDEVSLNPNPVSSQLSILSDAKVVSYDLYSLSGQLLMSGLNEHTVDVSSLSPGMYLFAVQLEDKREIIKFLKQ